MMSGAQTSRLNVMRCLIESRRTMTKARSGLGRPFHDWSTALQGEVGMYGINGDVATNVSTSGSSAAKR
jgi:hypothetical protein